MKQREALMATAETSLPSDHEDRDREDPVLKEQILPPTIQPRGKTILPPKPNVENNKRKDKVTKNNNKDRTSNKERDQKRRSTRSEKKKEREALMGIAERLKRRSKK